MDLNYYLWAILYTLLSYILGSFPTGILYARFLHNVDIRTIGSGNSGATNIGRSFGFKAAVIVSVIDFFKGFLPVLVAKNVFFVNDPWPIMAVALACVIGHAYPIWAGFKGGKIMATSVGIVMGFNFSLFVVLLLLFGGILYVTSTVSIASLTSFSLITLWIVITNPSHIYKIGFLLMLAFMFYRHRSNIKRLMRGQENRIGWGLMNPKNDNSH